MGKSELSVRFAAMLNDKGTPAKLLSFPGKEAKEPLASSCTTFIMLPLLLGVAAVSSSSLQLLHIAAHVDAIERVILPLCCRDSQWFWTGSGGPPRLWVSGRKRQAAHRKYDPRRADGVGNRAAIIFFLIQRRTPLRAEPESRWLRWCDLYERLAGEEQRKIKIVPD